ncbi:AMP binding protein [Athelia psychrophila]|uniref:AMP binding protein n=1 Tax=Athelia psychrophila TaxID=1759441 RepID=A0A166QTK2_9AGAM|nr:AMP binding protein [Fibularhizoctonia sp. CBS 109695]
MSPTIYKSLTPDVDLKIQSIFSHLFTPDGKGNIGGFPGSDPAFIDADTNTVVSRAVLRSLSLSLAYGLTHPAQPVYAAPYSAPPATPLVPLKKGDTVMIFAPNSIAWPVALFGSVAAGLRCTLANSAYTPNELHHQWSDSNARLVFAHPSLVPIVLEMFKMHLGWGAEEAKARIVVLGTEWLTGVKDEGSEAGAAFTQLTALLNRGTLKSEVRFDGKDTSETTYLCYSSGTTGKPKGVETTHANIVSVVQMVVPVFPPWRRDDVMLGVLPFYHIYGAVKLLHFPFQCGIPVVVMPRFSVDGFCAHVARYRVTAALVVPPMLLGLAKHPITLPENAPNLTSLRMLFSGAAPLGATLVDATRERLAAVGATVHVTQGYGLTETSPTTHVLPVADCLHKVGTIGVLLPNLEARLVDEADVDVAPGPDAAGELWLRGPSVMKGYLGNAQATADSITADGWFKTGDVAVRDDEGFWKIVDRRKELIKYKGFQVPPAELESALLAHPDIADVAVIGIDSRAEETELPRAYIVPAKPLQAEEHAEFGKGVAEWLKPRVARHKQLRGGVRVVEVIPKSAAGKILRRELRELAKKEEQDAAPKAKL